MPYGWKNLMFYQFCAARLHVESCALSNKKTNSFRGINGNVGGVTEGDQPNPNSFLSPYEQLEAESEALVSKLFDVVSFVV